MGGESGIQPSVIHDVDDAEVTVRFNPLATYLVMQMIDQAAFDELTRDPTVLLVEFTAAWCPPCKALMPVLDGLAGEYAGRVRIVAVDTERELALPQRMNVRSMPTCVLWRDGREVGRIVGSRPRAFIAGMLDRALNGDCAIASP